MNSTIPHYSFQSAIWKYKGKGAWYFCSLSKEMSAEIRLLNKKLEQGWGRLKTKAMIGKTTWDTAIWYDTKQEAYLLPIKAEVRRKEKLESGKEIEINIWI